MKTKRGTTQFSVRFTQETIDGIDAQIVRVFEQTGLEVPRAVMIDLLVREALAARVARGEA